MKVAELNDGEPVESFRQERRLNAIVPYADLCRIVDASLIEARRHEYSADQDIRQRQILEVKEVYALAEDLRLMVLLDPEALPRVLSPETLFKDCQNILVRHGLLESLWAGRVGQTRLDLQGFLFGREQRAKEADPRSNKFKLGLPDST
jgi:hypothetical protein